MLTLESGQSLQAQAGTASAITYTITGDELTGTTDAFKVLGQGTVSGIAVTSILTVTSGKTNLVKTISLANVTGGNVTIKLYIGGNLSTNQIFSATIPANGTALYNSEGWKIYDSAGGQVYVGSVGPSGTASVGTTTTGAPGTSANVTNSGTPSAGIFNFTIPAGAVWRSGTGVPSNGTGLDGDYYLRTGGSAGAGLGDVYLRASGTYSVAGNILGPTGTTGAAGVVQDVTAGSSKIAIGGSAAHPTVDVNQGNLTLTESQVTNLTTDLGAKFDKLNGVLTGVASSTYGNGKLVYDTDNDCLTFYNSDSNISLQIGQEFWIRVKNVTGSTIANGQAVYLTGTNSGFPTIGLAKADALATSYVVGVTTESIANNAIGFITSAGLVHNMDTSAFATGNVLFLSATTAGALTATVPSGANYRVPVAVVNVVNASTGNIVLDTDAALTEATTSLAGLMSAIDKKKTDNLWIDVTANTISGGTCVGDDSTLNDTAMANILSAAAAGSTIYFPPGTYRFASEININVDKRLAFKGANKYNSIIKTTSATANIFRKSVAGWYDSWTDLGFRTSTAKTAGYCIVVDAGNNIAMNVARCAFGGDLTNTIFGGISYTGSQSGNVSTLFDLEMSGFSNGGRGILINGDTINIQIHQTTINLGTTTTSACCEIQQSGAVQVTNFDWIKGTNVILFNSTTGAGPQACYFSNGFCDQPSGSVVKFTGGNTANRIKFTQVGIAPTGNNHAVEIAGTGAGAVGTTTALPGGLSFVDCDIYSSNGTNTGAGIFVNGAQDVNIQNSRITGFAGSGGAGVRIAGSASNQTKVRINGCIFGPNSNLTPTNATHVDIQAGSSGLGALSISDNQMDGASVAPLADASAAVLGVNKRISQNSGLMNGAGTLQLLSSGGAAVISGRGAVTSGTTETFMFTSKIPANSVQVGQKFRVTITSQFSGAGVPTYTLRSGAAGTIAGDTSICAMVTTAQVANGYVTASFIVEVVALGPTATVVGHGSGDGGNTAVASSASLFQTAAAEVVANVPTTAAWFITLGVTCATAGTATLRDAVVEAL